MINEITLTGTIIFDVPDRTKKHIKQSSWKKVVIVSFEPNIKVIGEGISAYYGWFIKKRYNLVMNPPLRGAHVSIINDKKSEITTDWGKLKEKWDGKKIDVVINLEPRSNIKTWWLRVPHELNRELLNIRYEAGLSEPYYKLHMTIGNPNEKNIDHSRYIVNGINKGLING